MYDALEQIVPKLIAIKTITVSISECSEVYLGFRSVSQENVVMMLASYSVT